MLPSAPGRNKVPSCPPEIPRALEEDGGRQMNCDPLDISDNGIVVGTARPMAFVNTDPSMLGKHRATVWRRQLRDGRFDVQSTLGVGLPTSHTETIGHAVGWN